VYQLILTDPDSNYSIASDDTIDSDDADPIIFSGDVILYDIVKRKAKEQKWMHKELEKISI
jgi:hypothetical protein